MPKKVRHIFVVGSLGKGFGRGKGPDIHVKDSKSSGGWWKVIVAMVTIKKGEVASSRGMLKRCHLKFARELQKGHGTKVPFHYRDKAIYGDN